MKQIKYITLSLFYAGCLSLTGCSLDEDPLYTQNNKVMFNSEANIEQALLGCYAYMSTGEGYGQQWQEYPITISGLAWAQRSGNSEDNNASLAVNVSSTQANSSWRGMYKVISETNAFIENAANSTVSENFKNQRILEARFLRGLAYFNLANMYGAVPLKVTASTSEGIAMPRTPVEQVYNFVIEDFKAATGLTRDHEDGRIDALAAKAYLCKAYHKLACLGINTQENLNNAKKLFEDEVKGKYQLQPKFGDLFVNHVKGSKESIFQLNFDVNSTTCPNRGSNRFAPGNSTTGVSFGTYRATKNAYDMMRSNCPNDPRLEETFLTSWRACQNNKGPKPVVGDVLTANDSVYAYPYISYTIKDDYIYKNGVKKELKKYVTKLPYDKLTTPENPKVEDLEAYLQKAESESDIAKKALYETIGKMPHNFTRQGNSEASPFFKKMFDPTQSGNRSNKNVIVFRYAELLLLMADVYNELNQPEEAVKLVNEVLGRARNSGKVASAEPKDWVASQYSKQELSLKIYFELIYEFLGEPNMFEITRLKGTQHFKAMLEKHNAHNLTKKSAANYEETHDRWHDRIFNNGDLNESFLKKNMLMPIPQDEITFNEAITEGDNNFGY